LPELASSGATPAWRASCASVWKRSIGPISPSSFAALKAPQPGRASSAGAVAARLLLDFAFELEDRAGEAAAAADELTCDPHQHRLLVPREPACEPLEPDRPIERARRDRQLRVELVQVPAQPLLRAAAFVDEVVAVIDEHLQLTQPLLTLARMVEPWLPQRRARDGEGVDGVGFPGAAAGPPLRRHQLRRHPHQPLARVHERPLELTGQLPAVLQRPQPLVAERRRPLQQHLTVSDGQLSDRAPNLVNRNSRQRLLVYVHTNNDHADRLLQQ